MSTNNFNPKIRCVSACVYATALFIGSMARAQVDTDSAAVLSWVQTFYDQTRDISAQFQQTYIHKVYNRTDRSSGRVVFKKPGKMRWDYTLPNGKIVVSNGQLIRIFEPGDAKSPGQLIEQPLNQADLPQAMTFLLGTGRLEQIFKARALDSAKLGFKGHVLELTPKKPNPHYQKVIFYVDGHPERRGIVHRVLILDSAGNKNRFDFSNLQFNRNVSDSVFDWKAPRGTQKINATQLRNSNSMRGANVLHS